MIEKLKVEKNNYKGGNGCKSDGVVARKGC